MIQKKTIPKHVKLIILAILENDLRISMDTMLCIIAKHLPVKLADEAEHRFWQSKCQQLMASIRDQDGARMVFHIPAKVSVNQKPEYILIHACSNDAELKAVRHRLHSYVAGLEHSISAVEARIEFNNAVRQYINSLKRGTV